MKDRTINCNAMQIVLSFIVLTTTPIEGSSPDAGADNTCASDFAVFTFPEIH